MSVQGRAPSDGAGVDGTYAILIAIAEAENVDVTELASPLADVIDPDALERLLRNADETTRVSFPYHRLEVEVRGNGVVTVTEPSDGE